MKKQKKNQQIQEECKATGILGYWFRAGWLSLFPLPVPPPFLPFRRRLVFAAVSYQVELKNYYNRWS